MYQTHLENSLKKSSRLHSLRSRISVWRLIFAASAAGFFYWGYAHRGIAFFLLSAAAATGFFLLVAWDSRLKKQLSYLADYQAVIDDYRARLGDGWKQFPIDGARYLAGKGAWAHDLDIFGGSSLYQYLCTASSVFGQDQLACWLSQPQAADGSIKYRQNAVMELAQKTNFTLDYEATARKLRAHTYDASKKELDDFFYSLNGTQEQNLTQTQAKGDSLPGTVLIFAVPAVTVACLLLSMFDFGRGLPLAVFIVSATLQLFASFIGHWHNGRLLAPVYRMNRTAEPYRRLFALILEEPFESPYLQQLQQQLSHSNTDAAATMPAFQGAGTASAVSAFTELESICASVVTRHNAYASFLLNSLFCYDFHCVRRFIRWKNKYRYAVRTWMQAAGCVEALISLGVIARTKQDYTMPQVTDSEIPELSARCLRHPLLKEPGAVGNDFELAHQTSIITGSNMSGKTTFMRSIGVSLILAYAGGYCSALSLRVSRMAVCTSMRTADDISEGISTFYAELLHIQKIIEISRRREPMITLIDEIYKGTNSKDRIFAARETARKLAKPYAATILTTHDLELCGLEQEPGMDAANYHFCEHYSQDQILFDYKIRQGKCETSNARFLLRMAGILDKEDAAMS